MTNKMSKKQENDFLEDLFLSLEETNFLTEVYNEMKLEEERFHVRDLQSFKRTLIELGFKVTIKTVSQVHGIKAIIEV